MSEPGTKKTAVKSKNNAGIRGWGSDLQLLFPLPQSKRWLAPSSFEVLRLTQQLTFHSHPLLKIHPGSSLAEKATS